MARPPLYLGLFTTKRFRLIPFVPDRNFKIHDYHMRNFHFGLDALLNFQFLRWTFFVLFSSLEKGCQTKLMDVMALGSRKVG